jgi:hypothetical protein
LPNEFSDREVNHSYHVLADTIVFVQGSLKIVLQRRSSDQNPVQGFKLHFDYTALQQHRGAQTPLQRSSDWARDALAVTC